MEDVYILLLRLSHLAMTVSGNTPRSERTHRRPADQISQQPNTYG